MIAGLITIFKEDDSETKTDGSVPAPQDSSAGQPPADSTDVGEDTKDTSKPAGADVDQEKTEPATGTEPEGSEKPAAQPEGKPADEDENAGASTEPTGEQPAESGDPDSGKQPAEKPASGESAK